MCLYKKGQRVTIVVSLKQGISTPSHSASQALDSSSSTFKKWIGGNPTRFGEKDDILDMPYEPPYSKIMLNLLKGNDAEICLQENESNYYLQLWNSLTIIIAYNRPLKCTVQFSTKHKTDLWWHKSGYSRNIKAITITK